VHPSGSRQACRSVAGNPYFRYQAFRKGDCGPCRAAGLRIRRGGGLPAGLRRLPIRVRIWLLGNRARTRLCRQPGPRAFWVQEVVAQQPPHNGSYGLEPT
jgi:hypothetical protein